MAVRRLKAVLEAKDKTTPALAKVSAGLTRLGAVAAAVGAIQIGRKLVQGMQAAVEKAAEQQLQEQKLRAALISTGQASDELFETLKRQASALQSVTDVGDETTLQIQAMLIQFGVATDVVTDLSEATLDMAKTFGIDYLSAATLVAKAVAGNVGALSRYGVVLDSVDVKARGATAVLEGLQRQFGGRARAEADTYAGAIEQLSNTWGDLQEKVGDFIVKSRPVRGLIEAINEQVETLGERLETVSSEDVMGAAIVGLGSLAKITATLSVTAINAAASFAALVESIQVGAGSYKQWDLIAKAVAGMPITMHEAGAAFASANTNAADLRDTLDAIQARSNALDTITASIDEMTAAALASKEAFTEDGGALPPPALLDAVGIKADALKTTIEEMGSETNPYLGPWLDSIGDKLEQVRGISEEMHQGIEDLFAADEDRVLQTAIAEVDYTRDSIRNTNTRVKWAKMERDQKIAYSMQAASMAGAALRSLFGESKAGAYASAIVNTAQGITGALAVPPPWLGIALAAIIAAAGHKQISDIKSTNYGGAARGGIVPGADRGVDSVIGLLRPGEMVLPKEIADSIGSGGGPQTVMLDISADSGDLAEILSIRVRNGSARLEATELTGSAVRR